jgi:hypothetical protein
LRSWKEKEAVKVNKQDAIGYLEDLLATCDCLNFHCGRHDEAIKMAISALEQQLTGGWIPATGFTVIDTETGQYPDMCNIARREEWSENLIYCDIEGFAITEDGYLIAFDECGNMAYCPEDRFKIISEPYKEDNDE